MRLLEDATDREARITTDANRKVVAEVHAARGHIITKSRTRPVGVLRTNTEHYPIRIAYPGGREKQAISSGIGGAAGYQSLAVDP
ncbi:MAG: hypothetical protein LBH19_12435, partial [Dysgonamonadaceae bacterium]|nr:hypothetical protein [Dysgonamonadaceae bacterium]